MRNLNNVSYNEKEKSQNSKYIFLLTSFFDLRFGQRLYFSNHEFYRLIFSTKETPDTDLYHYNYDKNTYL